MIPPPSCTCRIDRPARLCRVYLAALRRDRQLFDMRFCAATARRAFRFGFCNIGGALGGLNLAQSAALAGNVSND